MPGTEPPRAQHETEYLSSYTNIDPYLAIGIGSGSASPSFYDVDLSSLITLIDVAAAGVSVTDNGTHIVASYTVSYTASSAVTVREVGLYWKAADYGTNTYRYYLFARDVLSSPISLAANDVLAVTYTIAFKYNQPPMTYNFAALMFNYLFGLNYYGKALSFTTTDGTHKQRGLTAQILAADPLPTTPTTSRSTRRSGSGAGRPATITRSRNVRSALATTGSVQVNTGNNSTHFYFTLTVGYPFKAPHGQRGRPDHRQHRHRPQQRLQREAALVALLPVAQPGQRSCTRRYKVHVYRHV
jgi:hypothetical protein